VTGYDYYNQQYSGFQQHMSNFLASDLSNLNLFESYYPPAGDFAYMGGKRPYHPTSNYYPKRSYHAHGFSEATPNAELIDSKYNARDFQYNGEPEGKRDSRFFIIKSYSKEDVIHAARHSVWCSTETGNAKLDAAFAQKTTNPHVSVYLFFSVNGSGQFCGLAEMASPVDFSAKCPIWTQDKWKGKFEIKWIYVKDIPNNKFKHVLLPNNEDKPVTNSRDCQEVLFDQALEVLNVFRTYNHRTTILDEVDFSQFDSASAPKADPTAQNKDSEANNSTNKHKPYSYRQQKMQQNGLQTSTTNGFFYDTNGYQLKRVLNRGDLRKKPAEETTADKASSAQNEASAPPVAASST
jgi:hypothetical protein